MELTEHHDLRGGDPVWRPGDGQAADSLPATSDIVIIGSGIMGATIAERLSVDGHRIVLLDRRPPGHGSTAASTAELMWAMDVPLTHLARKLGEDEAARRWRRVYRAVSGLGHRIDALGIDCARVDRPTLYLEGGLLDRDALAEEGEAHRRHALPSTFLDADGVAARFGIAPRAGLVSSGGFEVDPVALTHGLLDIVRTRGGAICHPRDVLALDQHADGITLRLGDGATIKARTVILAGGYERAPMFLPAEFSLLSSFAFASPPGLAPRWCENAMIWEAADPYLYVRTTADGRIVAGGEDEDFHDPARRDAMIAAKAGVIAAKLEAMLGSGPVAIDRSWAATFGASPDGLPAIGRAANTRHLWIAAGFGGNGIAFAALAGEIIAADLSGMPDPDAACFDPYRFAAERGQLKLSAVSPVASPAAS
ncbi:MAG: NAD(P)/FAD-dependent oxidoreductase [Sphingobium sp.]